MTKFDVGNTSEDTGANPDNFKNAITRSNFYSEAELREKLNLKLYDHTESDDLVKAIADDILPLIRQQKLALLAELEGKLPEKRPVERDPQIGSPVGMKGAIHEGGNLTLDQVHATIQSLRAEIERKK